MIDLARWKGFSLAQRVKWPMHFCNRLHAAGERASEHSSRASVSLPTGFPHSQSPRRSWSPRRPMRRRRPRPCRGESKAPRPATQVVATDTTPAATVTATVDANGNYTILGLTPVDLHGQRLKDATRSRRRCSSARPRSSTSCRRRDRAQAAQSSSRAAAVSEVRTQTVSTNITPAQIENLPQNKRNFLSFAALAPGVQVTAGRKCAGPGRRHRARSSPTSSSMA